jgi:hypothetical protein
MKTLAFALVVAFVGVAGCKGNGTSAGNSLAKLTDFKDAMCKCKDAACAQDVSAKMTAWTQEQAKGDHPAKMNDADTAKAQQISDELGKCMAAATTATNTGSAAAAGSAAGSAAPLDPALLADLPKECLDYRATVEKLATCGDKLPADVREVLTHQFDESAKGWAKLPPDAKKTLGPACDAGRKAIETNAKAQCGW